MYNLRSLKWLQGLCFGMSTGIGFFVPFALPAFSQTPQETALPPNIEQLLDDFELTPAACSARAAVIQIGSGTVCVQASDRLPAGNYTYDPDTNEIRRSQPQTPQAGGTQPAVQFTFRNILDYSNCLEDILQFYKDSNRLMQQGRRSNCAADTFATNANQGFSRDQALQLIRAADAYATAMSPAIYPPAGMRKRIAEEFGFTYALDTDRSRP